MDPLPCTRFECQNWPDNRTVFQETHRPLTDRWARRQLRPSFPGHPGRESLHLEPGPAQAVGNLTANKNKQIFSVASNPTSPRNIVGEPPRNPRHQVCLRDRPAAGTSGPSSAKIQYASNKSVDDRLRSRAKPGIGAGQKIFNVRPVPEKPSVPGNTGRPPKRAAPSQAVKQNVTHALPEKKYSNAKVEEESTSCRPRRSHEIPTCSEFGARVTAAGSRDSAAPSRQTDNSKVANLNLAAGKKGSGRRGRRWPLAWPKNLPTFSPAGSSMALRSFPGEGGKPRALLIPTRAYKPGSRRLTNLIAPGRRKTGA